MDDAWGRAVPDTPENQAQKADDLMHMDEILAAQAEADAKAAEKAAEEAEKADKKRLKECKRHGIAEVNCPPLHAHRHDGLDRRQRCACRNRRHQRLR